MRNHFLVHSEYDALKYEIEEILHNFNQIGIDVVAGQRNHIKKVDIRGKFYNVKKFKRPNFLQGMVYQFFRKSKARRSFEYASELMKHQIGTPKPVAYFESFSAGLKDSFYVCEHIDHDLEFRALIHNPRYGDRNNILRQFTGLTFKMNENGVNFLDHSPGNTLIVNNDDGSYSFYLIDLNRMRFEKMNFKKRMRNFRRLWLSKTMIKIMAMEYSDLSGLEYEKVHQSISKYSRAFQKKVNSKKIRRRKRRK